MCASRNYLWLVMLFVFLFVPNDELLFLPRKMDLKWCQMKPFQNDICQCWLVIVVSWYLLTTAILEHVCLKVVIWLRGIHSQNSQSIQPFLFWISLAILEDPLVLQVPNKDIYWVFCCLFWFSVMYYTQQARNQKFFRVGEFSSN